MRMFKRIVALFLLPLCVASTRAGLDLLGILPSTFSDGIPAPTIGLLAGFVLWLFMYIAMPRPVRTYVLAHELTHALWGWAMGAEIRGINVSAKGGHVRLTHTNFLITLAPYFFPFYTFLILLLHFVLSQFYDMRMYEPVWMGWVGLTWSFHLTFTLSMLRIKQPDIQEHGRLFSYTLIYLFNVLGLSAGLLSILDMAWPDGCTMLWARTGEAYSGLWLAALSAIHGMTGAL